VSGFFTVAAGAMIIFIAVLAGALGVGMLMMLINGKR
jgi:hypothetical protein